MSFKEEMAGRTTAAIRRCMDAGLAPRGDVETVSLDLRTAVHGAVSLRVNQPERPWPPLEEQVDRFLRNWSVRRPRKGDEPRGPQPRTGSAAGGHRWQGRVVLPQFDQEFVLPGQ